MHADFAFTFLLGAEKSAGRVTYNKVFISRIAINPCNKGGGGLWLVT